MGILNWEKDATEGWRAKQVGDKAAEAQVDIRRRVGNIDIIIIVSLNGGYFYERVGISNLTREMTANYNLHISAGGAIHMTWTDYHELIAVVDEAKKHLEDLEISQARRPQRL